MENEKELTVEAVFFRIGIVFAVIVVLTAILYFIFPKAFTMFIFPCFFHEMTGLYCPGCGGTRAVRALLNGNIVKSFLYNPIVMYFAVFYVWFMVSHTLCHFTGGRVKGLKYRHSYLIFAFVILMINCVIRNILLVKYGIRL